MEDTDKTEDPTGTKLDEARGKGDVARSRDFANFFVFLGAVLSLSFAGASISKSIIAVFKESFTFNASTLNSLEAFHKMIGDVGYKILWILSPFFIGVAIFTIAGYLSQFGFLFTTEKLNPDMDRLNPFAGLKRLFAKETFVELIKSTLKIVIITIILYLVLKGEAERVFQIGVMPIESIFLYTIELIEIVLAVVLVFLAILGTSDLAFQKYAYWERMKMSVQEVKDEFKNKEGDPMIKSRMRQIQRERARARMMEDVPNASVVVTNPTHVAVALKYERGQMRAPVVVAKGAGFIAVRIKEIAINSGVPVMEKRELARFLYRNVEVKEMIPESLYSAVAEVLAYVYRIKRQFQSLKEGARAAV